MLMCPDLNKYAYFDFSDRTNEAALQQCNTCHYRSIMPKTVTTVCEYGSSWSMAILVWGHIMEVEACQRRTVIRREYKADDRNSHVLHSDMYHYWLWMTPGPRNMNKAFQLFQKAALTAIEKISIQRREAKKITAKTGTRKNATIRLHAVQHSSQLGELHHRGQATPCHQAAAHVLVSGKDFLDYP